MHKNMRYLIKLQQRVIFY